MFQMPRFLGGYFVGKSDCSNSTVIEIGGLVGIFFVPFSVFLLICRLTLDSIKNNCWIFEFLILSGIFIPSNLISSLYLYIYIVF